MIGSSPMLGRVRRRLRVVGVRPWLVRVLREDRFGHQRDQTDARFDTDTEALGWALAQLEWLRATKTDQLGGPACWCYLATVHRSGQAPIRGYLFSDWEPVEWDWCDGPC